MFNPMEQPGSVIYRGGGEGAPGDYIGAHTPLWHLILLLLISLYVDLFGVCEHMWTLVYVCWHVLHGELG